MVHRTNLDVRLEHPKASFNISQTLVALYDLVRRRIRIGHQQQFAVEQLQVCGV